MRHPDGTGILRPAAGDTMVTLVPALALLIDGPLNSSRTPGLAQALAVLAKLTCQAGLLGQVRACEVAVGDRRAAGVAAPSYGDTPLN